MLLKKIYKIALPFLLFGQTAFTLMGLECIKETAGNYHLQKIEPEEVKKEQKFFKIISRTEYIERWGLLDNTKKENLNDHLLNTSRIAHTLAIIKNKIFGGSVNADKAAVIAMHHDTLEVFTDDMPTPIKYSSIEMKMLYSKMEDNFADELLKTLPEELREEYKSIFKQSESEKEIQMLVKAADTLDAIIKCAKEKNRGNKDFETAEKEICTRLMGFEDPAVKYFIKHFLPAFGFEIVEIKPTA
ncbi:MAG: 5'-deoxynucleotidase [Oscillospiraceae bacterium]|jgi:5'-deoxynucleotidase|nr:5'-deoxynucleotidase [Oscillospiraceae bacterium]